MPFRRPILLALLAAILACGGEAVAADSPTPTTVTQIVLAHTRRQDPAAEPDAAQADEFKRQVEARTAGRVTVAIFPEGQLGGNRDMARLVSRNIIQSALVTVGGLAPEYPRIAVLEMPFALASPAAAYTVFDGPFGRRLADDIERQTGVAVLGYGEGGGFFLITNARHPVHSVEDMRDLKIRSIPGFWVLDALIRGMGATPVAVSSREEYTALSSRVVDGQMSPPMGALSSHFDEVQKFATLTDHLYVPTIWLFNRETLSHLSPADQEAVRQAAVLAVAAGRKLARELEASDKGLPSLRRRLTVVPLTSAERQAFKAAAQPAVSDAIAANLGEDGSRLLAEFMAAAGGQSGK